MAYINPTAAKPLFSLPLHHLFRRGMALWSMTKDPSLERALSRNRRWILNNQIKNLLLRSPTRSLPVRFLQKKYRTLDMRGSALNWLKKYPCCFQTFPDPTGETEEIFFGFTKRMAELVAGEEEAIEASEPEMVTRLSKLLMLSRDRRLNVSKLNVLKRSFGFPDDYLLRLVPNRPDLFRIVNRYESKIINLMHLLLLVNTIVSVLYNLNKK
jgi:Plant organelle RNA recognition domain